MTRILSRCVFSVATVVLALLAAPVAVAQSADAVPPAADSLVDVLATLFNRAAPAEARRAALLSVALADPRAKAPLIFLLTDADIDVRAGAVKALGRFVADHQVETAVIERLERRSEARVVRLAAIATLAQASDAVAEPLYRVYTDEDSDLPIRSAARDVLSSRFPAFLAGRAASEVVDRSGRALLIAGSAALGSYGMAAVGGLGRNDAGITIGAFGGALVGAGTAFFLTRTGEVTPAESRWVLSGGAWGAGFGMLAAGAAQQNPATRLVLALGLLGESTGVLATAITRRTMPFGAGDVVTIDLAGLAAIELALGGLQFGSRGGDPRLVPGVVLAAGASGVLAGALITRKLHFSDGDVVLTGEAAYEGAWAGWLLARASGATADHRSGALQLGLGLGFVGGAALAQVTDYRPADSVFTLMLGSYGKVLGASVPMLAEARDERVAAGALAGSVAAVAAGYLVAPKVTMAPGGASFVAFSTALGLWHGLALSASSSGVSDRRAGGATLLGASAGGLLAMPIAATLSPTTYTTAALAGGSFWGSWFSAWGVALSDMTEKNGLRLTLAAGDVGLAASGLLVSPVVALDPRRMGIANLGGLAGAAVGSMIVALASKDRNAVITGNLAGSAAGLVFGSILAANLDLKPLDPQTAHNGGSSRGALSALSRAQVVPLVLANQASSGGSGAPAFGLGLFLTE